jgi:hypothetical protein
MSEIDQNTEVLEDFELLLQARDALTNGNSSAYEEISAEIGTELAAEYKTQLGKKVRRWVEATVVPRFFDRGPVRYYIQAKMLYRDGFYEATIMLCRSTAEMICYERLDGAAHPFGTVQDVERRNFRELLRWLRDNDARVEDKSFQCLNDLYDIGNNYIHPKSGMAPAVDSLKSLHLLGESLLIIYGVKGIKDLVGRRVRSAYLDFPDINSGQNFLLAAFATPQDAEADAQRSLRRQQGS